MPETKYIMRELARHSFIVSVFAICVASVALFTGHMSDVQWNVALAAILTFYGAAKWKKID